MNNVKSKPEIIKDIKLKLSDMGRDSYLLIEGKIFPSSSIQVNEAVDELGEILVRIPLVLVEVLPKTKEGSYKIETDEYGHDQQCASSVGFDCDCFKKENRWTEKQKKNIQEGFRKHFTKKS
jgi:hypothetical protein